MAIPLQLAARACSGRPIAGPLRLGTAATRPIPVACARTVDQRQPIDHRGTTARPLLPNNQVLRSVCNPRLCVMTVTGGVRVESGPGTLGGGRWCGRRSQWRQQRAALSASAARHAAGGSDDAGGASYWVLEIQPDATDAEVRHAFYRLVLGLDEDAPEDHELFRQLAQAYQTLHPDANRVECADIKVALAAALKDVDADAEGLWMAGVDDDSSMFFEDGEVPEGYFDDDFVDSFEMKSDLAEDLGGGDGGGRARDLEGVERPWDIADPNNSSPRDSGDYADELLAGNFEKAFGDDLQPWDIAIDSPAVAASKKQFVFDTNRGDAPVFQSAGDMVDADEVDFHMAQDHTRETLHEAMIPEWPLHEVANCLLDEQGDNMCVVQVDPAHRDYATFVMVVSARSTRHLRAMGQRLLKEIKKRGLDLQRGQLQGRHDEFWLVYNNGVYAIHVMRPEARQYYTLENLWAPLGSPLYEEPDNDNSLI